MPLPRSLVVFLALIACGWLATLGWLAWEGLWRTAALVTVPVMGAMPVWVAALRRRGATAR